MPFSNEYFDLFEDVPAFHDKVAQKYVLASAGGRISERLLRCIWYDRLYSEQQLATRDGKKVAVHSPGTWNLEAGPDFRNAELTIGEARIRGDIELHIDPAGWRVHGHSLDPRYDRVVLHVTLAPDAGRTPLVSRHGVEIPEVALWDCLTDDLKILKSALRTEEYPYRSTQNFGRCHGLLKQMPQEVGLHVLRIAGDARMIAKQRRFAYENEKHDLDQVAYMAILEGMGYKAYTKQFARLAHRIPYARLRERVLSVEKSGAAIDRVRLTQALLQGSAGLLQDVNENASPETQRYFNRLRDLWCKHGFENLNDDGIMWKASPVRPANLPQRRIAGLSNVLAQTYRDGLFKSILMCVLNPDAREARRNSLAYLTQGEDDFWSYHYSPAGRRLPKPVSLIGRDRALTVLVNSFVPLTLLFVRTRSRDAEEELVHQFYSGLPSLLPNNIIRLMEYKMFGHSPKQRFARTARTQQGLLQIFADWCSEDPSCENCGIVAGLQGGYIRESVPET